MTRRLVWTDELRERLARLKRAGMTHQQVACRMGLTLCQVYWGWKLYRENAPERRVPLPVNDALISRVSYLRKTGFSRSEIAMHLDVPVSRIDAAIALGKKKGVDMTMNTRIYREKQREHGRRYATHR